MKSDGRCRITGIAVTEIKVSLLGPSDSTMRVTALFHNDTGETHGKTESGGPWPKEVVDSLITLRDAIEQHLLRIHFEGENDRSVDTGNPRDAERPVGIFDRARIRTPEDEAPQV